MLPCWCVSVLRPAFFAILVAGLAFAVAASTADAQLSPAQGPSEHTIRVADATVVVPDDWVPSPAQLAIVSRPNRQPARQARLGVLVPSRVVPFRRPRRPPNYGVALNSALGSVSQWLEARGNRKTAYALDKYLGTVPAGKPVTLDIYTEGSAIRAVIPRGQDKLLSARWKHDRTVVVTGTNVELAKLEGYHCSDMFGCWSPELLERYDSTWGCSATGRSPDQASTDCTPLALPDDADTTDAWRHSAELLRRDLKGEIEVLVAGPADARRTPVDPRIHAADMQGYRQAVYLASTFVGSQDPDLGAQIGAAGTAVLDVYDALHKFRNLPTGASENLAAVALTGNLVSVGFALAGALMDIPSEAEIVVGEIRHLQAQVTELRAEMRDRFDGVHEHLDEVYVSLSSDLEDLVAGDKRILESVIAGFANNHALMSEIGRVQLDTAILLYHQIDTFRDEVRESLLANCERVVPDQEWQQEFRTCRNIIAAQRHGLRQPPTPNADMTMDEWLKEAPDATIAWSFDKFKRLLVATGPGGGTRRLTGPVVGPDAWFKLMDLYDGFLVKHPDLASRELALIVESRFAYDMSLWRSNLVRFAEAIREELRAYQDGSRPTAFSVLLADAWSGQRLEELLLKLFGDPVRMSLDCMTRNGHPSCAKLERVRESAHVRDDLLQSEEFRQLQRTLDIAGAHLRSWITLAFRNSIVRSEAITALVAGWVTTVDLEQLIKSMDVGVASWPKLIDEVDRRMLALGDMLRSNEVRKEASSPFEHEFLTNFDFFSLGDMTMDAAF